jgi:hypothetical protein
MRRRGQVLVCTNCGLIIAEPASNHAFARFTVEWGIGSWCDVECYLSFIKSSVSPLIFTELRTDISDVLNRSLKERPPRSMLESNGGSMTLQQYHNNSREIPEWGDVREKRHSK